MPLSDAQVKNAKAREKVYRVSGQYGLCIELRPTGRKFWRYRYRFGGKAQMLNFGEYPAIR